jgi:oligoribonuclease
MSDFFLWVDLETSGLDLAHDHICEVAVILTGPPPSFDVQYMATRVVGMCPAIARRLDSNQVVEQMHHTSGLLDRMRDFARRADHTIAVIDHDIDFDLAHELFDDSRGQVRIAGSGVAHFDLPWVRRWMPNVATWLHWRPLDVGQLEEWRIAAGLPTFDDANPEQAARKTHRAADDIRYHLDEGRFYLGSWAS